MLETQDKVLKMNIIKKKEKAYNNYILTIRPMPHHSRLDYRDTSTKCPQKNRGKLWLIIKKEVIVLTGYEPK